VQIDLVTVIVDEYDPAIAFFTEVLGFDLAEDSPSLTNGASARAPSRTAVSRYSSTSPAIGGTFSATAEGAR
jgi:catechol 2,3-dioxygenase-like lactoylglutathione lyase family enzyme